VGKDGDPVDDSGKGFITAIGSKDETEPVLRDLASDGPLGEMAKQFWSTRIPPTVPVRNPKPDSPKTEPHWLVSSHHLPSDGHPSIVVQDSQGHELGRLPDYSGGAEALGRVLRREPKQAPSTELEIIVAIISAAVLFWPRPH